MIYVTVHGSGATIKRFAIQHKDPFVLSTVRNVHRLASSHASDGQPFAIPEICQAGLNQSIVVIPGMQTTFLLLL